MPRPKNGYANAAGQPIPGTHDPISRYMDQTALKIWAHKQGLAGLPLYQRAAIDIGATVHGMAELDLKGRPGQEIEAYARQSLTSPDQLQKAFTAFAQFKKWRAQCDVRPIALEVTLVSEAHQYGGTPDVAALVQGKLALIDFKTSAKPYPDHWIALAAHGRLWDENNPQQPLQSYHLICLPKDGSGFQHHAATDLSQQWQLFTLYLDAYRIEKGLASRRTVKPATVASAPKAALAADAAVPAAKPRSAARKPAEAPAVKAPRLVEPSRASLTMAELLRSYGHIREPVTC
jgi:hypothetical protein